jgi:hypothetical protein
MSSRIGVYRFDDCMVGRTVRKSAWRRSIAPVLVALVCILMAVAAVTVAQPDINAPAMIG